MSFLATLPRLLLCLALILNGSVPMTHAARGGAMRSTVVAVEAPAAAHDMAMTMDGGHGCHDGATDDAPPSMPPMPSGHADQDDGMPHGDGCCDDGDACRSAWAQHCTASIPAIVPLRLLAALRAGPLPLPVEAHPDPRLADRIRPPIA